MTFAAGLELQNRLHGERANDGLADHVLFIEHSPVISMGRRGEDADVLVGPNIIESRGVEVARSDRGGQVTFHGPGQLVVYFIVGLGARLRQVRGFVEGIETSVMDYLADRYGIASWLENENPGIWTDGGKIAAVGISLSRHVSMHGLALNLSVDTSWFRMIVPCGIKDRPPVSVADLGHEPDSLHAAADALAPRLGRMLGYEDWSWV